MLVSLIKNQNLSNIPKLKQQNSISCGVSFKGNDSFEYSKTDNKKLVHQTALFREPKTDEFVQNYVMEKFADKPEINIVSGACSSGEEVYSYACMLNDSGKKINITGFDISNEILESAKNGIFDIKRYKKDYIYEILSCEGFLLDNYAYSGYKAKCKRNFLKYFEPLGEKEELQIPSSLYLADKKRYKKVHKLLNTLQTRGASNIGTRMSGIYQVPNPNETYEVQKFKFKFDSVSNCDINFKHGDILKLDELFPENGKIDVFLYRNALYHTICMDIANFRIPMPSSREIMNSIAKEMNRVVSKDGLVVFGEEEDMQGVERNHVNDAMMKNGFKPICLHKKFGFQNEVNIWQKVSNVE